MFILSNSDMPYRRNYKRRRNIRRKRVIRRRLAPARVRFRPSTAKYQLANKVELIRPITLKPSSVMKKFIYYNTAEVRNATIADAQNSQFVTFNLNSPWILQDDTYTEQGNNTWKWNTTMAEHSNGSAVASGTTFPGIYGTGNIGLGYANSLCVGTKFTLTGTPIFAPNSSSGAPAALFAVVQSQSSHVDNTMTIDELYSTPYTQVRKISSGGTNSGDLSGNTKSASIVLKYSPKRFNNIKDLRDNHQFNATLTSPEAGAQTGKHPDDKDRVTFGLVNVMTNPVSKRSMGSVMIQVKVESTYLFTEPFNSPANLYPAIPIVEHTHV